MYTGPEQFDPENITPRTMKDIHASISNYLEVLEEIMIPPEDMDRKQWERMQDSVKLIKKDLLRRLKKGDVGVFVVDV